MTKTVENVAFLPVSYQGIKWKWSTDLHILVGTRAGTHPGIFERGGGGKKAKPEPSDEGGVSRGPSSRKF